MKTTKTLFLLVMIFLMTQIDTKAQASYDMAGGLRAAWGVSLTGKKFINDNAAIEGILNYRRWGYFTFNYNRITLSALYEYHVSLADDLDLPGLSYYYGGGLFVGRYGGDFGDIGDFDGGSTYAGLLGVIGIDYAFEDLPINISVDWMPGIAVSGYGNGFAGENGGVAIRYIF